MNEADALVDGEPQFWGGCEIALNTEPLEVIKEILKACGGRLFEIGGVYKLYVGAPGLPVLTMDDGVLRADEAETAKPIRPLDERVNYISGSYTRPEDGWITRVGPPRFDASRISADGRVGADLDVPVVQSGKHFQRLQQQLLNNAAKERRHNLPLPPSAWGVEPGDVLQWTSEHNGYEDKLFEVEHVTDDHSLDSVAAVLEIDHDDYDFDPETDLIEEPDGVLDVDRPAPKEVGSFAVAGVANVGTNNTVRPAVSVSWDDPDDADVTAIRVAYRIAGQVDEPGYAFSYEPAAGQLLIVNLQPATNYEVKAQFESFNGWATETTPWLPVVTPDIRFSQNDFNAAVNARMAQLDTASQAAIATVRDALVNDLTNLAHYLLGQIAKLDDQDQAYQATQGAAVNVVSEEVVTEKQARAAAIQSVEAALDDAAASLIGQIAEVDDKHNALATLFGQVFAENGEGAASALFRLIAHAAPTGVAARIALEAKTAAGAYGEDSAALFLDVIAGVGSVATIKATAFRVQTATGFAPILEVQDDTVKIAGNIGVQGDALVDGSVTASKIAANAVTAEKIAAGAVQAGNIAAGAITANKIQAGTITADRIVTNGITQSDADSGSASGAANGTWRTLCTINIEKDSGTRGVMFLGIISGSLGGSTSQSAADIEGRILRGTSSALFQTSVVATIATGGAFTIPMSVGFRPGSVPNGNHTIRLQVRASIPGGVTIAASGYLYSMLPRA
ncbi:hypothetical protein AUC70_11675 [Methyloceanibacter stevinii]|uniref:Fibronectin type-III domain-containing protein n=1 Tax=Methyloceanibacter stevinii TaxID=1774970 RepID=A0A1E3VJ23_9HYPH|nr:phage tail protein [Methyloceanibacter stevinii]ODR93518.1 hypothetical protein AUC70_11675 [Methyloceanibacter stevinii]